MLSMAQVPNVTAAKLTVAYEAVAEFGHGVTDPNFRGNKPCECVTE